MPFLLAVYGADYEPRLKLIFKRLQENYEPDAFNKIKINMNSLVKYDVKNGMMNNSDFLVTHAKALNKEAQRLVDLL